MELSSSFHADVDAFDADVDVDVVFVVVVVVVRGRLPTVSNFSFFGGPVDDIDRALFELCLSYFVINLVTVSSS